MLPNDRTRAATRTLATLNTHGACVGHPHPDWWVPERGHDDTDKAHVHIIVNRVHPDHGKAAKLSKTRLTLSKWAEAYEKAHGIHCHRRIENNKRRAQGDRVIDLESRSGRLTLHVLNITTRAEAERIRRAVLAQEERVLRAFDPDPQAVLDARPRRGKEPSSGGAA